MKSLKKAPWLLFDVPDRFMDLGMLMMATIYPLRYIPPDHPKAQEVCERTVGKCPSQLKGVPEHFKTEKMCEKVINPSPWMLGAVPDYLKARWMCNKALDRHPYS